MVMTNKERERYGRQILLDEIGAAGQEKLKKARVLVAGAGGLGSPISIYLAAAGVGFLRIVDLDEVSLSNLNRQILYKTEDQGRKKAITAAAVLAKLNPQIRIEGIVETITPGNVLNLAEGCCLIMDAMDNFSARYLLNEAALEMKIPYIYGGIHGLEGALTTIIPGKTACLKCIFPSAPPPSVVPVLGATAGVIGTLQAMEAVKYITGAGDLLADRLLTFDGYSMQFREIKIRPDPECACCAANHADQ